MKQPTKSQILMPLTFTKPRFPCRAGVLGSPSALHLLEQIHPGLKGELLGLTIFASTSWDIIYIYNHYNYGILWLCSYALALKCNSTPCCIFQLHCEVGSIYGNHFHGWKTMVSLLHSHQSAENCNSQGATFGRLMNLRTVNHSKLI